MFINRLMLNATSNFPALNEELRSETGSLIPKYERTGGTPAAKIINADLISSPRKPQTIAYSEVFYYIFPCPDPLSQKFAGGGKDCKLDECSNKPMIPVKRLIYRINRVEYKKRQKKQNNKKCEKYISSFHFLR